MRKSQTRNAITKAYFDVLLFLLASGTMIGAYFVKNSILQNIVASISASFFFFLMTRIIDYARKKLEFRKFRQLFGNDIFDTTKFCMVYPNFVLSETVITKVSATVHSQGMFAKKQAVFSKNYRIDIPECVAINDIQAMAIFIGMFGAVGRSTSRIESDNSAVNWEDSFLSFGLSSNECTHMYLDYCKDPVFTLNDIGSSTKYSESIEVSYNDKSVNQSQSIRRSYASDSLREIGIFLKFRPDKSNVDRHWFYCAGLGPVATVGVAKFMEKNWEELHKKVNCNEFLAIFSIPVYSPTNAKLIALIKDGELEEFN